MKNIFFKRLFLWSIERFPPIQILAAFLTFSITTLPIHGSRERFLATGTFIVYSILLILRILDEHKDYQSDLIAHPKRVLQSGVVSLSDLRRLGLVFGLSCLTVVAVYFLKIEVLISGFFLVTWIVLMTAEFFIKNWISKRLLIYSLSHLLLSPLLIYFCATLVGTQYNQYLVFMMLLSFFAAFSYEVARKSKGLDEQNPHELNYVGVYGSKTSMFLLFAVNLALIWSSIQLAYAFGTPLPVVLIAIYVLAFLASTLSCIAFIYQSSSRARKLNESISGLVGLIGFVVPLAWNYYA
jgi:hypothetical protein